MKKSMLTVLASVLALVSLSSVAAWKGGNDPELKAGIAYNISADSKLVLMFSCLDKDFAMVLTYHDRKLAPNAFKNAETASFSIDGGDWMMIEVKAPDGVTIPKGVSAVELAKHEVVVTSLIPKLVNGKAVLVQFTDHEGKESITLISLEGAGRKINPAMSACYPGKL